MTLFKALATVVGTALGFGLAGIGIGAFLGKVTPAFFRHLFPLRDPDNVDTLELGMGLGLVNGLTWGLVIGILVVAVMAWKDTRMARLEKEKASSD